MPPGDCDYSKRWGAIKKHFTQSWLALGGAEKPRSASRIRRHRRGVWQPRFMEHTLRDERDYARHFDHIHYNPVKYALAECPRDWPSRGCEDPPGLQNAPKTLSFRQFPQSQQAIKKCPP